MPILALNKRATFDYQVLTTFEAGLVLFGHETKSLRNASANLKGAYISFGLTPSCPDEAWLIGAHISKYQPAGNLKDYDPYRPRKILLQKKELRYLAGKRQEKGLTVIPIKLYTKNSFIKLEIAIARGKKSFDKREDLKKKETERHIRTLTKKAIRG